MIYILKIEPPLHHAKFYVGYSNNPSRRLKQHARGEGANITKVAIEKGHKLELIATKQGNYGDERQIKQRKNTPKLVERIKSGKEKDWSLIK